MKLASKLCCCMSLEIGCLVIGALEFTYGWMLFSYMFLISLEDIEPLFPDFCCIIGSGVLFALHGLFLILALLQHKGSLIITWLVYAVVLAILCLVALIFRTKTYIPLIVILAIISYLTFIYMFAVVFIYYREEKGGKKADLVK